VNIRIHFPTVFMTIKYIVLATFSYYFFCFSTLLKCYKPPVVKTVEKHYVIVTRSTFFSIMTRFPLNYIAPLYSANECSYQVFLRDILFEKKLNLRNGMIANYFSQREKRNENNVCKKALKHMPLTSPYFGPI